MTTNNNETKNNNVSDLIEIGYYYDNEWFVEDISEENFNPPTLTLNVYIDDTYDSAPDIRLLTNTLDDDDDIDDEDSIANDESLFLDENGEVKMKVEIASMVAYEMDIAEMYETFNVISKANEMLNLLLKCYDELGNENLKKDIKELLERPLTPKNEFYTTCGNCGREMLCYKPTLRENKDKIYYRCICNNPIYTGEE